MGSARPSRLAADARRDQLIHMGLELLGQRGYDELSVMELARAAGISKGLLYHYFPTKADFVTAVLRQAREELQERMTIEDGSLDPVERMSQSLDAFLSFVEEHAAGYRALARARAGGDEEIRADLALGRRRQIDQLVGLAAALAGAEHSAIQSAALESALAGWLAFSEEVVVRWLAERDLSRDQVLALLRDALLAALAAAGRADGTEAAGRLAASAVDALLRNDPERPAHERVHAAEVRVRAR